ncbi:CopG family transcriptional regulator [Leptolyngbyaceae cyanobacterium UHCC 1019]
MSQRESRFDGLFGAAKAAKSTDNQDKDVQTSKHSHAETFKISDAPLSKSKDPDYQRTTVYLPKALHRKLRATAIADDREMSDVIKELVQQWLESK